MSDSGTSLPQDDVSVPILSWEDTDIQRRRLLHARRAELVERDRRIGLQGEVVSLSLQLESLRTDVEQLLEQRNSTQLRLDEAELTLQSIFASRRWRFWSLFDRLRGRNR